MQVPVVAHPSDKSEISGEAPLVETSSAPSPLPTSSSIDPPPSDLDIPIAHRKGTRSCIQRGNSDCRYPISACVSYSSLPISSQSFIASLDSISVPKSVPEALCHDGWRAAMEEEMMALEANHTWDIVSLPSDKQSIGCKWVFTVKVNPDGSVARLKARLVAKGYAQTYGVDYSETFSPVAKITSVRLFISLAASHDWPLYQLDVKNAFLHGDLSEEVYMEQPPGFVAQGEYGKVCRLKKSLYGLKQSPRAWFGKFSEVVIEFGMKKSDHDHSVFYKQSDAGCILLAVYVDDIVITGSDKQGISKLKNFLQTKFQTKDLGVLRYFLGIEIARGRKGIFLSQRKYVLDLLKETGMIGAKPSDTPMIPNVKLGLEDGELLEDPERYRRLVGKLNYLTITRPDIAFSVSVVSQFMNSPRTSHWNAVMHILSYLKKAPGRGILYKNSGHCRVKGFSDADWTGCPMDRRSTSGYCVFVGGNLVSWKSKKQAVVSRSSAESEYRAMAHTTSELVWISYLLHQLGIESSGVMQLWCDNRAAIHIATNPVFHERTKHVEVDCHFIRQKLLEGVIDLKHIRTREQLANLFTKALPGKRVDDICNKLGMFDIYAPA